METKKIVQNENSDETARQKIREAVHELTDLFIQVCIVKNILFLLDDFLEEQDVEIAEPASVLQLCVAQLDCAHRRSSEIMDIILDYSRIL